MSRRTQNISIGLAGTPLVGVGALSLMFGSMLLLVAAVLVLTLLVEGACRFVLRPVACFVTGLERGCEVLSAAAGNASEQLCDRVLDDTSATVG